MIDHDLSEKQRQAVSMKEVGVILLNWNGAHFTIPCIESLQKSSYPSFQIIVVDNGSTDGSADQISRRFPDVAMVRNPANIGFAGGNNVGIDYSMEAGANYILILNNDTVVDPGMISELLAVANRNNDAVAVCPKIYWYHQPERIWFAGSRTNVWTGNISHLGMNQIDTSQYERVEEIGFATGCCILIPRKMIDAVGKFDPEFFMYCEDVDWSLRCRHAGFRLLYAPKAKLRHVGSGTARNMTALKRYLFTRNTIWTMRRNAEQLQKVSFFLLFYPLRAARRIGLMAMRRDWQGIQAELRGAKDGFLVPLLDSAQLAANQTARVTDWIEKSKRALSLNRTLSADKAKRKKKAQQSAAETQ